MKFKKAVTVFLAAALTCSLSVMPVLADEVDDLKQQKENVQNEVKDHRTGDHSDRGRSQGGGRGRAGTV